MQSTTGLNWELSLLELGTAPGTGYEESKLTYLTIPTKIWRIFLTAVVNRIKNMWYKSVTTL